jgi:2-keto-4-pentenoate hydratase
VFGLTEPVYAGLFESGRAATLAEALARPLRAPSLECEIAFVLGSPLDGSDLSDAALADAVAHCHIACEIIDNRYGTPLENGVPTLLADDFFHAGYVIGPENPDWRKQKLELVEASIVIDGKVTTGSATDVLSAFASLRWLSAKLAASAPLAAGDIVLTGSITVPVPITLPARDVTLSIAGFAPLTLRGSA